MSRHDGDEVSARGIFRRSLLRLREQRAWSLTELSGRTNYDPSYLQRLEKGGRLGSLDAAQVLDRVYDSGELHAELWQLAKRESGASRFEGFNEAEAVATGIHAFSLSMVPGLLQTPGYAEAVLRLWGPASEEELAGQVLARIGRQERLTGPRRLHFRGLLDESVIRRPIPDSQAWAIQLERLVEAAQEPNVSLQIVPLGIGPHALVYNSLQLLWLPSGRTVAYIEHSWSGQLVHEPEDVERFRLAYDLLRDSALSTADSLALLRTALEDTRHAELRTGPEHGNVA